MSKRFFFYSATLYICYIIILWYKMVCIDRICWQYLRSVSLFICIYKEVIGEQEGIHDIVKTQVLAVDSLNIYTWTFNIALKGSKDFASLTNSQVQDSRV